MLNRLLLLLDYAHRIIDKKLKYTSEDNKSSSWFHTIRLKRQLLVCLFKYELLVSTKVTIRILYIDNFTYLGVISHFLLTD